MESRRGDQTLRTRPESRSVRQQRSDLSTLGVVYYRLGQLTDAIETLEAAIKADRAGGIAQDFFFLAMSYQRFGDAAKAQDYFSKGTNRVAAQSALAPRSKRELETSRAEAEEVLGITESE